MRLVRTIVGLCLLPVCFAAAAHAQNAVTEVSISQAPTADDSALDDAVAAELAMAEVRNGYQLESLPEPSRHVFTFRLISSSVHNSALGWTQMTIPVIAYRFNQHWSMDLSVPAFLSVHAYAAKAAPASPSGGNGPAAPTTYSLKSMRNLMGDTSIATRYTTDFGRAFTYTGSATLSLPSGADSVGLGNGQATYNLNHRLDYIFSRVAPFAETGIGDTSSLVDRQIQRNYTTVGHIAHFQAGAQFLLPFRAAFTASAFENLPLGDQKIYRQFRRGNSWTQQAVGVGLAEDNGFDTILDVPLNRTMSVSGFYSHSTRLNYDTTGVSVILSLRNPFHRSYQGTP
ncbi:hypothetical protein [Terriglobus tenax]|uniref:hypothetical protein n=1 Tax=Terriglobus tenax TaxID=1111115 RepID=UPI0021DFCAF7|nr:hypothetical protein [Terriglobus tenax]